MTTRTYRSRFPRIPYGAVRWLMGRVHVGTPDVQVVAEFAHRSHGSGATPAEVCEVVRYALACHAENRNTYSVVMSGRVR